MRHARVAPAIYGGFQISFKQQSKKSEQQPEPQSRDDALPAAAAKGGSWQWITQRVAIPQGLQCVLFIPDEEASTEKAISGNQWSCVVISGNQCLDREGNLWLLV